MPAAPGRPRTGKCRYRDGRQRPHPERAPQIGTSRLSLRTAVRWPARPSNRRPFTPSSNSRHRLPVQASSPVVGRTSMRSSPASAIACSRAASASSEFGLSADLRGEPGRDARSAPTLDATSLPSGTEEHKGSGQLPLPPSPGGRPTVRNIRSSLFARVSAV